MRNFLIGIISLVLVIAIGAGAYSWYQGQTNEEAGDIAANDLSNGNLPAAGTQPTLEPTPVAADGPQSTPAQGINLQDAATAQQAEEANLAKPQDVHITVDGIDPKAPRSIGKLDAPVTMIEYSSLTCPHCAHAHTTILPQLIKDYVETGKLRVVFSDFPLNQQALDASKVSRCVANDQYFGFLTMLFGSIETWAYAGTHPQPLIQTATLTGLSADKARACMADAEVEAALVKGVQEAAQKYNISSTPTFVFNEGKKTIAGARPYAEFKAAIDSLLPAQ